MSTPGTWRTSHWQRSACDFTPEQKPNVPDQMISSSSNNGSSSNWPERRPIVSTGASSGFGHVKEAIGFVDDRKIGTINQ